ncbi:hypothetical protein CHS0354_038997 [Potamilus streckersoni]|uniref:Major facilitator superfamily (MFS) profile domain-containing protein n=1 Tax=Potamilus streckersoni TaxID=2493646 RepID=A0AAE0WEN8_9BIVA|nr:hypothetical protein CHS0354_038997 [Potamilus streckersoni]
MAADKLINSLTELYPAKIEVDRHSVAHNYLVNLSASPNEAKRPQYTKDNFPDDDGSLLILCLSITSGVSRIVFGKVADLRSVNRVQMQQASFFVLGICTLCIPFSASFGGLIAISLLMGICDGIFVCLLGPIAFDIVGQKEANQAIGFLLGTFSIPFTIGPPVAGYLYDLMGNYRVAFHVAGAPPILGAILMFFIPRVKQNFPGVTTSQEFASISKLDIYSSTTQEGKTSKTEKTSATSGTSSEIVVIQASDILNFGPKSQVSEPDVERQAMLSEEDEDVPESQHNESIAKDKKSTGADNGYSEKSKELALLLEGVSKNLQNVEMV